jgi:O-acetylhomoserine/O-acetylserine sulfhydrylase-like pyridoxal-dependent enzyme
MSDDELAFATRAVHAGAEPDELTGAVAPPIYQTSTYAQDGVGKPRGGYEYARSQNPTRERLERAVAAALADCQAAYDWSLAHPGPGASRIPQATDSTFSLSPVSSHSSRIGIK